MKKKEGEVEGEDEEGADGSVFFAAKWQRARADRVETSAATSQEYKRTTDSQATGHLLTTSQSAEFLCLFSPTTYFTTTRLTSPSALFSFRSFSFAFLIATFRCSRLSPAKAVSFQFSQMLYGILWMRLSKRGMTNGGTIAALIFRLEKVVGRRWFLSRGT